MYNKDCEIKFKTSILKSSLCDYTVSYILVSGTITITGARDDNNVKRLDKRNKGVIFKNCASFTDCMSEISNTQIDNAKDIDTVMPMYILLEYSDNYSKTSGRLWQCHRDGPNANTVTSESFKLKII